MEDILLKSLREIEWSDEILEEIKQNSTRIAFVSYGSDNPMFGLKGENHPSHHWHKNFATKEYYENKRESVLDSWMNADERRKQHSEKMKSRWQSGKITPETARKNGQHGMKGKDIHNTLDIEYKGVVYYGWRELKEATGVSKALYKKYYLNGIDPETRIGTNGPKPKTTVMKHLKKEVSV
jgi:hypothetical protein